MAHQMLKVKFCYKTYRWQTVKEGNEQGSSILTAFTNCTQNYHPNGPLFPVKGLRVAVFWDEFQEWYNARVKRWSKSKNMWVLQYDVFRDSVYEDVPVWKWRFFT